MSSVQCYLLCMYIVVKQYWNTVILSPLTTRITHGIGLPHWAYRVVWPQMDHYLSRLARLSTIHISHVHFCSQNPSRLPIALIGCVKIPNRNLQVGCTLYCSYLFEAEVCSVISWRLNSWSKNFVMCEDHSHIASGSLEVLFLTAK